MYLSLTTTARPATDLGFLAHKNPARVHESELAFGKARLFYPEASEERCTLVLALDIDPVALVRGTGATAGTVDHYVNDRPYAASSFLSVAMGRTLREAMSGRSKERPELAASRIPLEAVLAPVPLRDDALATRLFAPLGYDVAVARHPLDEGRPDWGDGPYVTLTLRATCRLSDLLTHLSVLVPVMDGHRKHYYLGDDEVEKLMARGGDWLAEHPERKAIVSGYLNRHRELVRDAESRFGPAPDEVRPARLNDLRHEAVAAALAASGARRVLDLGCGEGRLLARLAAHPGHAEILGVDASARAVERAGAAIDRLPRFQADKAKAVVGALTYRDKRLSGYDAAALVEVIEHVDPARLPALERCVFGHAKPRTVVVTTPNAEHNAVYGLGEDAMRHHDHRFEFDRAAFAGWCARVGKDFGYDFAISPVGEEHPEAGAPTQMATFTAKAPTPSAGASE